MPEVTYTRVQELGLRTLQSGRAMGATMDEKTAVARDVGPLTYVLFLLRGPLLVTALMVVILLDFLIPGSMKEALRYSLLDQAHWYQFAVIAVALVLACGAVRFSGEAIIELVAPDLLHGPVRRIAHLVPRLLAASLGIAVAVPLVQIILDGEILKSSLAGLGSHETAGAVFRSVTESVGVPAKTAAQGFAAAVAGLYVAIALFVAVIAPGPHTPKFETREPSIVTRVGLALFPLLLAATFAVAVMGSARPGISYHALERYSTAFIAPFADASQANEKNELWTWVCGSRDPDPGQCDAGRIARYAAYITDNSPGMRDSDLYPRHFVNSAYSIPYVLAMLLSLFAACYASRLAVAAFVDLLLPGLGGGGRGARFIRRLLPPLASAGLGFGVAAQFYTAYFPPSAGVALDHTEIIVAWAIMATYGLIGIAASFGSSSRFAATGAWQDSPSVGRRFVGSARRLAALDPFWHWYIRGLLLLGGVIFFVFANLSWVAVPQWIGPVGIILLWGATCTAVLFFLSYIGHATHIPFLTIIAIASLAFAGFNINENHGIRLVQNTAVAQTTTARMDFAGIVDKGQTLELVKWVASRNDLDRYTQADKPYPVFLVATEGGGARAAYFTATVLAALQERCPAFAQHTIAISGVSGGSLGASVFAALASGGTSRDADPQCRLAQADVAGMDQSKRKLVLKARETLSADLLSPLLGAMLFPDTLQRMLPFPIPEFDRARALEYAVEKSWKDAAVHWGGDNAPDRDAFAHAAEDLYTPHNAVPNLILNSTEAGSGANVPLLTASLADPQLLGRAQIDDGNINCGKDWRMSRGACVLLSPSPPSIKSGKDSFAPIPLSSAAIVSARFPFLTPAATFSDPNTGEPLLSYDGHFVDGGYFENSGTFMLSRLLHNLVSEQMCLKDAACPLDTAGIADKGRLEKAVKAARSAVFVVIIIQSEPCTRRVQGLACEEAQIRASGAWSEILSPVKALLSTRDARANYTSEALRTTTALIEELNAGNGSGDDVSCSGIVCAVTLRFFNKTNTDVPLTWVLSDASRRYIDEAVDGMESADVTTIPAASYTHALDPVDENRVLGSYRRVLCLLAAEGKPCQPRPW
ncbi:hypothetical protein GCM10008942_25880 [Rhizomicrobium electricum]|uniref:PNPLA domain-containing protein n=2 Tax=Rhizomicrobium electricum TaxID=480070 RepID=A0ABP3PUV9_9PROT